MTPIDSFPRFFIHQTYAPNNVIDVSQKPFHLIRRGWGEFPARIQIHFKNPANKPVDVVHSIRLDKTYTGLQTLGSETLIDVWLKAFTGRLTIGATTFLVFPSVEYEMN